MQLIPRNAPHIRHSDSNRTMMFDMILTLMPLYVIGIAFYGLRVLITMLLSAVTAWLCDLLCSLLRRRKFNFLDFSGVVTGLIIPLMFPASIPYFIVIAADVFAIAVVKHPFGGTGENLFNPAAGGIAFALACWPAKCFAYPAVFTNIPLWDASGVLTVSSTATTLQMGGIPGADFNDMLLGLVPGPVGTASILVLLACLIYLVVRRSVPLIQPVCFLAAAALMAFLFPRADVSRVSSVFFELFSGSLVFGAVFMLNDPVTSPKRLPARALYGFVTGIVVMVFRHFGAFEREFVFTLLFMNVLSEDFDRLVLWMKRRTAERGKRNEAQPQS